MKPLYKILLIIGAVILIGLIIYFVWQLFAAPAPTSAPAGESSANLPVTPGGATGGGETGTSIQAPTATAPLITLKKLSDNPVFDFWTVPATREIYYFTKDGRVLAAKEGPDLEISNQTVNALNFIRVGPDDQKILAAFGNPASPQWGIFDLIDKVWRPLPNDILNATWGQDANQLVATVKSGTNISLVTADLLKTPPVYKTIIKDFRFKDVDLTWKPPQTVVISERPSALYETRVWQLDLKTLNFNMMLAPEKGLNLGWSRDKNFIFKFSSSANQLVLLKNNFQPLALEASFATLPQKCAALASTTYCFQPQNLPERTVLPDDYFQKKFYSIDNLFKLDLNNDSLTKIMTSNNDGFPPLDGLNPQIIDNDVYFVNRYDGYLYQLHIQQGL